MNVRNKLFLFGLLTILSMLFVSCSNNKTETSNTDTIDTKSTAVNTRGIKKMVSVKAYHYTSLVSFKDGFSKENLDVLAALEGKKISLVLLYESSAPWANIFSTRRYEVTGNDMFNSLMASYELKIVEQFSLNENNDGLVIEPNTLLENPIEVARKLSLIEHVLMVQIKEVPQEESIKKSSNTN